VVNAWRAICAALVIFAAGVVTGGLTVRLKLPDTPTRNAPGTFGTLRQRGELVDRLQRQLYLTPPQRTRIEQILHENHDRMKQLWDSIAPQAQEEHRRVQELIRAELTPEQQKAFEELMKRRPGNRSGEDWRRHDARPNRRTNLLTSPGLLDNH
jgi:Spy/CpxP family protein refolding chaperone